MSLCPALVLWGIPLEAGAPHQVPAVPSLSLLLLRGLGGAAHLVVLGLAPNGSKMFSSLPFGFPGSPRVPDAPFFSSSRVPED